MAIRRKQRGFTLIEIIVYCALSIAALVVLISMVQVIRRTGDHTYAQYLVSGNMATTIRMIRKELQATSLASITSYGATSGQAPGFSCVSAYDDKGEFKLGSYGTPHWQKHVYYTLNNAGVVTRWTQNIADKNYLPSLAPSVSATPSPDGESKALMNDALPPNKAVGTHHPASSYGGLEVGFVRRNGATETVVPQNPRDSANPEQNTRLLQVTLRTLEESGPNFLEVKFRVHPRY